MNKTTKNLIEQYHTISRRPSIQDPGMRETIFESFARSLGALLPPDKSSKILDAGCGEGAFLYFLKEHGYINLFGFDLSSQNVSLCHSINLDFVTQFDALSLAELEESDFDVIFALDLIEHLPKEEAVSFIEQLYRLLKAGGYVVVQTPNMGSMVGAYLRYNDLSHEFGLTENTALSLFTLGGFEFNKIEVLPSWNATTTAGYLREIYLRFLHRIYFLVEGSNRPRIVTKNLLIIARK